MNDKHSTISAPAELTVLEVESCGLSWISANYPPPNAISIAKKHNFLSIFSNKWDQLYVARTILGPGGVDTKEGAFATMEQVPIKTTEFEYLVAGSPYFQQRVTWWPKPPDNVMPKEDPIFSRVVSVLVGAQRCYIVKVETSEDVFIGWIVPEDPLGACYIAGDGTVQRSMDYFLLHVEPLEAVEAEWEIIQPASIQPPVRSSSRSASPRMASPGTTIAPETLYPNPKVAEAIRKARERSTDVNMAHTKTQLVERGEKLSQLATQTQELESASKGFLDKIKEYNLEQEKRSGFF
jgi:hypothetical protein